MEELRKNGYVLYENFINHSDIDNIVFEAKYIFEIQLKKFGLINNYNVANDVFEQALYKLFEIDIQHIICCGKQLQHMISLHQLALNEKIINQLKKLGLEHPILNIRPVIFFNNCKLAKRDVDWKKPAHQDWRTTQGSIDSLVVWIPLIDIPKELGTLEIVPGSHKLGLEKYIVKDDYNEIQKDYSNDFISLKVNKGDALFFSTLLIHRSGNNITESIRWSCHFRYNNIKEKTFIERGFPHTYSYGPQQELVTPDFPTANHVKKYLT